MLYFILCTLYFVLCTLYFILCTLYFVLCSLYFVLYTLYFVLLWLNTNFHSLFRSFWLCCCHIWSVSHTPLPWDLFPQDLADALPAISCFQTHHHYPLLSLFLSGTFAAGVTSTVSYRLHTGSCQRPTWHLMHRQTAAAYNHHLLLIKIWRYNEMSHPNISRGCLMGSLLSTLRLS